MRSLAVTDSTFANQRNAVKEERRLRIDNQPYSAAFLDGLYGVYDSTSCLAYAHPPIGSMADLDAATADDARAFFKLHYTPNNARLVVAGDFEPAEARRLIAGYFGDIPRGDTPSPVECRAEFNRGEVRRAVTDKLANLPAAMRLYRVSAHDHPDTPALELLGIMLGQGESSRLNVKLAREARAAVQTQAGIFGIRRGPSILGALAIANQGVAADSLDAMLAAVIGRLAADGVTDGELAKAKNIFRATFISQRECPQDIAEELQHYAMFHGSIEEVNTDFGKFMAVTPEDILRVAAAYLRPENVLIVIVNPEAAS